jgi:hypothetical protein
MCNLGLDWQEPNVEADSDPWLKTTLRRDKS